MAKFHDQWEVQPHGPLRELAPGLLTVVGQIPMPLGKFPRRMTVVALPRKRTAIWSPIPLDEEGMARIEALGSPAFLIVPNHKHRLDSRPFKARYPKAKIVTAPGARKAVEESVPLDATDADLGKNAKLITVAGTRQMELAMLVRHEGGASLITNDIIGHVRAPQGIGAWIMARLAGFGPRAQVPRVIRRMLVEDSAALAKQLRDWARIDNLVRLVPSHGDIVDRPQGELLRIAAELE